MQTMKTLYESILDDEDEIIDRMGNQIINNEMSSEYIKKHGEYLVYSKIDKIEQLFNSRKIKGMGFLSDQLVTGIGFAIINRKKFPESLTKNYKGWGIYIFEFGENFERAKDQRYIRRVNLIPVIF